MKVFWNQLDDMVVGWWMRGIEEGGGGGGGLEENGRRGRARRYWKRPGKKARMKRTRKRQL